MEFAGTKWTDVLQLIISIVGFVAVVYQIQQLRRGVRGDTHSKLYAHYLEVSKLLLDKPHLRPYFYQNKLFEGATEDPRVREEVGMMCELITGLLEHAVMQRANLPADSWENCWRAYTYERFRQSEELRAFFAANRGWYAKTFRDVIDQRPQADRAG